VSPLTIAVIAFGMSIDSLIVSMGRGAVRTPRFGEAVRTGLVFGTVEMLTPLIGWFAGMAAARYVAAVDHWIAFALLGAVGGHMLIEAFRSPADGECGEPGRGSLLCLIVTAIGTSIDAMAVGVSLALLDVDIVVIALAIGATTFVMSTGGMLFGSMIGRRFGRWAAGAGGLALLALGVGILGEHLALV